MILKIYEGTPKKSLRYSLELKMATLYTSYWRYKIKRRVDLYNVNEHVYFGELTLYDNGGFDLDITYETDLLWGRKMDLSCVSDNYASNKDKGVE